MSSGCVRRQRNSQNDDGSARYTVRDAARRLGVNPGTIYDEINAGRLRAELAEGKIRVLLPQALLGRNVDMRMDEPARRQAESADNTQIVRPADLGSSAVPTTPPLPPEIERAIERSEAAFVDWLRRASREIHEQHAARVAVIARADDHGDRHGQISGTQRAPDAEQPRADELRGAASNSGFQGTPGAGRAAPLMSVPGDPSAEAGPPPAATPVDNGPEHREPVPYEAPRPVAEPTGTDGREDTLAAELRGFYASAAATNTGQIGSSAQSSGSTQQPADGSDDQAVTSQPEVVAPETAGFFSRPTSNLLPFPLRYLVAAAIWIVLTAVLPAVIYRLSYIAPPVPPTTAVETSTPSSAAGSPSPEQLVPSIGQGTEAGEVQMPQAEATSGPIAANSRSESMTEASPSGEASSISSAAGGTGSVSGEMAAPTAGLGSTAEATELLVQLAQAEAELRSGVFQATITPAKGTATETSIRFDLGSPSRVPVMELTTTSEGDGGQETVKTIRIGSRAWVQQGNSDWQLRASRESVADQVQAFLPQAEAAVAPVSISDTDTLQLRWQDVTGNSTVVVEVDRDTGVPQSMRRENTATGEVLMVVYEGWNAPVEVLPPENSN